MAQQEKNKAGAGGECLLHPFMPREMIEKRSRHPVLIPSTARREEDGGARERSRGGKKNGAIYVNACNRLTPATSALSGGKWISKG